MELDAEEVYMHRHEQVTGKYHGSVVVWVWASKAWLVPENEKWKMENGKWKMETDFSTDPDPNPEYPRRFTKVTPYKAEFDNMASNSRWLILVECHKLELKRHLRIQHQL